MLKLPIQIALHKIYIYKVFSYVVAFWTNVQQCLTAGELDWHKTAKTAFVQI